MVEKCIRCGRKLTSPKSIKRGYGATCFRIVQLQQVNIPEVKPKVNQEIEFLKCEINMLKRMFKQLKANGVRAEAIERINQARPEQETNGNKTNFGSVIAELKKKFLTVENAYDLLAPVNSRETIELPPIMVEAI